MSKWKKNFPVIVLSESIDKCYDELGFSESSPLFTIEEHPLFEDMKYHLPNNYEVLFEKWNRFKEKICDYDNKRKNIFKIIDDNIYKKLGISFPAGSIYARAVSLIKEEISLSIVYNYYIQSDGEELRYGIPEANKGFTIGWENALKIEKIKEMHTNISLKYSSRHNKEIKEVIEIERELKLIKKEINKMLDELTFYPLFPNMNCKYINP